MTTGQTTRRPSRGVRNNNPGNIRHNRGTKWQGASPVQADREFVSFVSPEMGVRALIRTLLTYYKQHNLRTVHGIITRWAPPVGNANGRSYTQNTGAYVDAVCRELSRALGRTVNAREALPIDSVAIMRPLVIAIIAHENNGHRYPASVIAEGMRLGGIHDAMPRGLMSSGETQAALVSGTAATGAGVALIETLDTVRGQLEPLAYYSQWIALVLILLTLAGAGWTVWSHFSRKRRGLA